MSEDKVVYFHNVYLRGDLSIDRSEGPLNKFLKIRLLLASTKEVYFVLLGVI